MLIVVPILAALHSYLGWRLLPALALGRLTTALAIVLLIASTLLMPLRPAGAASWACARPSPTA